MTNSYPEIVRAAQSLRRTDLLSQDDEPSDEEIREFLSKNRGALDLVRSALGQPCFVPLEYSQDYWERHRDETAGFGNLARALKMDAIGAERDGRTADELDSGITLLHLANAVRRNGLIYDMLVSNAIAGLGIDRLRRVRHRLRPGDCAVVAAEILCLEEAREPFAEIAARDAEWERRVPQSDAPIDLDSADWSDTDLDEETKQLIIAAIREIGELPPEAQQQLYRNGDNRDLALRRLLAVECALSAYRASHGVFPEQLAELAPAFIKVVPPDPYSAAPFGYRRQRQSFLLYGMGPRGGNNEERLGSWYEVEHGDANLCLDADDYAAPCDHSPNNVC
jgi:hypothetical protein